MDVVFFWFYQIRRVNFRVKRKPVNGQDMVLTGLTGDVGTVKRRQRQRWCVTAGPQRRVSAVSPDCGGA